MSSSGRSQAGTLRAKIKVLLHKKSRAGWHRHSATTMAQAGEHTVLDVMMCTRLAMNIATVWLHGTYRMAHELLNQCCITMQHNSVDQVGSRPCI